MNLPKPMGLKKYMPGQFDAGSKMGQFPEVKVQAGSPNPEFQKFSKAMIQGLLPKMVMMPPPDEA